MKKSYLLLAFLAGMYEVRAQDAALYERQLFIQGNDTLPCRILSPLNFSAEKKYPLVVFLHGSGERGNDNEAQLKWGSNLFTDSLARVRYPAIIVFPQCARDSSWATIGRKSVPDSLGSLEFFIDQPAKRPLQLVMNFIDTLIAAGRVDPSRVYVGGMSLGGFGTFELLWRKPHLFAAAFPICGGGNPAAVRSYARHFPVWVFHGAKDLAVPVGNSRLMVKVLKENGAMVKYSEYPTVEHNSWVNAFAEPDLLPWLFAQRKGR